MCAYVCKCVCVTYVRSCECGRTRMMSASPVLDWSEEKWLRAGGAGSGMGVSFDDTVINGDGDLYTGNGDVGNGDGDVDDGGKMLAMVMMLVMVMVMLAMVAVMVVVMVVVMVMLAMVVVMSLSAVRC